MRRDSVEVNSNALFNRQEPLRPSVARSHRSQSPPSCAGLGAASRSSQQTEAKIIGYRSALLQTLTAENTGNSTDAADISGRDFLHILPRSAPGKAPENRSAQSSIIAMGSCYGTTGYMGVPILLSVFGSAAAAPAAIATILHNIPAIMAVIITHDICAMRRSNGQISYTGSVVRALTATISNPLTISVLAGAVFSVLNMPVPVVLETLAKFLGAAAGPTALFALGLSLARLNVGVHLTVKVLRLIGPMTIFKIIVQPLVTYLAASLFFDAQQPGNLWLITAIIMAGQPVGAGVYVFANKYDHSQEEVSLAIINSLLVSLLTFPLILSFTK